MVSANDSMALGGLEALKRDAPRQQLASTAAVKEVEAGNLLASVDFNMFKIGCTARLAAVRYQHGEPLPDKVMLPAEIIDKSNYMAWLVPVEQRACPDWAGVVQ